VLDETVDASTVTRELGGCPVKCFTVTDDQDARQHWQEADALREETPAYDDADEFRLDRKGAQHFGLAGGPPRGLGAHLARREMLIAVVEWHAAISHQRIATDKPLAERGGQLALWSLPLVWDVTTEPMEGTTA
jgi:hypothetical protein